MTDNTGHLRTSFLCVDQSAENAGSPGNENGALLYLTQSQSGTAQPLAFNSMYEVSCSHCTVLDATGGSVFVDWGTQTCPGSSTTVYAGQAAGAASGSGGGHENLCLPSIPSYLQYNPSYTAGAFLYAAQYQTYTGGVTSYIPLNRGWVPCAVCQRPPTRPYGVVIPGTTQCPLGFALDYSGFLTSPPSANNRGQYACATSGATFMNGKASSTAGALWTQVQGIFPLPLGYFQSYELTCAVCSGEWCCDGRFSCFMF